MTSGKAPTSPSERIVALDAVRGFALLGILLVNIQLFSMPELSLLNPTLYGDLTGGNYWVWAVTHVLVEGKFITLFTFLFGSGIVLFTRDTARGGRSRRSLHTRRSVLLAAFGIAHAYLFWYGDILFIYGVCALLVVSLRDSSVRTLLSVGLLVYAVPSVIEVLTALLSGPAAIADSWELAEPALRAEIEAYRGDWFAQMDHRVPSSLRRQTVGLLGYSGWRVAGAMLLGMALFKSGVLRNDRSSAFYRRVLVAGSTIGTVTAVAGVVYIGSSDWAAEAALFWRQFNYWASLPLATAYVALVTLYCRLRPDGAEIGALAAVGRTAFSNYVLQTLLATSVFYGHGLGLFGTVTRTEALGVVVTIWAVQIPLSVLWLRYFRFGPMEWLWRVLTYGQLVSIRASG